MPYDPERHRRRSIRLRGYDYARSGVYAVTICAHARRRLFGRVVRGAVRLSEAGRVAYGELLRTPALRPYVALDAFVVMPDHIHVIFIISRAGAEEVEARPRAQLGVAPGSLGAVVRGYKAAVASRLVAGGLAASPVWQRNYYESLLRTDDHLAAMRRYIAGNPQRWRG